MSDFIDGLTIKEPNQGAPDFVLGKVSFQVEKVIASLRENQNANGWVNADLKRNRDGKLYIAIDNYQKGQSGPPR